MTFHTPHTDHPAPSRTGASAMVRAVVGWVLENDRKFRAAQSMVDNPQRRF